MTRDDSAPLAATIEVGAGAGAYPAVVEVGALERLPEILGSRAPAAAYRVISDDRVAPLYGWPLVEALRDSGLDASLEDFPAGEASKTREHWGRLTDALRAGGLGRDGCVVAIGGGVTGDLGGFVAATYMRGVALVQVPTSLVAMIDASIGGKVGVDTAAGKNLVGAFHPPRVVVADPAALATLDGRERAQGLVEALKHGAILDEGYFDRVASAGASLLEAGPEALHPIVVRSVEIKAAVVTDDERESGRRQILNFGHTLGHAIEAASGYLLGHGEAVAAGMILEARLGEALGATEPGTASRLEAALADLGMRLEAVRTLDPMVVRGYLGADKKVREGRARYVLLRSVGTVEDEGGWSHDVPAELVDEVVGAAWRA